MIYKMTLKDSADEMTFDLLEVPIVDKDIEGAVDNVTLDGNQYTDYLWLKKQFVQKWSILCDDEYTRLRGFYTRQFENADVPSYRLYYGDDIIRNSTLSGERIELSIGGVADGTMSLTQVDGNTEQASYTGKNLAPYIAGTTTNGVNLSVSSQGVYKLLGTATADTTFSVALPSTLASGTYRTMSINIIDGGITGTSTLRYRIRDTNGSYAGGPDIAEITVSSSSTGRLTKTIRNELKTLNIWVASGCNCTNFRFTLQLENGQTATVYEPYVGGIPAPNPQFPMPIETVTGSNTVKVTGKNILDYVTTFRSGTYSGITATLNDDGSIMVSGVPTSNYVNIVPVHNITDTLEDGATYSLSASGHDGMLIGQLQRRPKNGGSIQYIDTITGDKTITINKSANEYYAGIMTVGTSAWGSGATITRKFQLERGSVTSFEPFKGQGYEINLIGKNLLDVSLGYRYGYIQNSGQYADNNIIVLFNGFIPVEPNTTYTFSSNHANWNMTAVYYADMTTFIDRKLWSNSKTNVFTTPSNCHFVRLQVNYNDQPMNDQQVAGLELQLEKSSSATSYEAHYSTELCKMVGNTTTWQDRIYKNLESGKWYLHKEVGKVTLNGLSSEDWVADGAPAPWYRYKIPIAGSNSANYRTLCLSDHFYFQGSGSNLGVSMIYGGMFFCYPDQTLSTLSSFTTWLASNPTAVYYPLATPTTTEITNEALVEELEALQDEAISVGLHNIYTDTPNALPTLTFDLTEYLSQSTTIIPETAVRLTLTDGGVINACGCRKDVQLTMRETIE